LRLETTETMGKILNIS